MMKKYAILFLSIAIVSCATYKPQGLSTTSSEILIKPDAVNLFLIGDPGYPDNGNIPLALTQLKKQFEKANKDDILLFLGDNVYPKGIPSKKEKGTKKAKKTLNLQLEAAKNFPGKVYFVPGNHDWYSGIKGLERQEKMVVEALGKNTFLPEDGCGIKRVNINDDLVVIFVDSYWYITNWNKHPTINDDCEIKTREAFLDEFRSEIKKARGKTTLVAIHHPMYSNGPHNGRYGIKEHLKPVPVLGTIKNAIRTTSGVANADMSNPFYNDLRKNLIAAAQQNENVIFVSGHEHSMQYIEEDNLVQIVSGSGSKVTPVRMRNANSYGHGVPGYAILNIHNNQAVDVQFVNAETQEVEFSKRIKQPQVFNEKQYPSQFPDSIQASVYTKEETTKSGLYKFLWGERYRKYFSTPVMAKTVDLDTLYGGLKPVRKGGGNQSKSLRLEAKDGRQYVMRAVRKSATQYIQAAMFSDQYVEGQFDDTATESLVLDVFTGSHPYTPLTVATLSDAVGVYHLNPRLFYVPKQRALQEFNNEFGDDLYLLEEHASEGHTELASGKFTGNIISTTDVLDEIHSDEDKEIDQINYLRSRLFDMLIGDWDRHYDQWRWMEFKENGKTIYRALPRDRDQAFSVMSDGFLLGAGVTFVPAARLLRKYSPDLKDVKGINVEPYPLDMAFLTQVTKKDWDEQAGYIQEHVTDAVIDQAMALLPKEVQDTSVDKIKATLKQRRENLQTIANRYYKLVSKFSVIKATNKDDFIKIEAQPTGAVKVTMLRKKDGTVKDKFHQFTYTPENTKEIWIYGLDDDDSFEVTGKSKHIKIRLIGGQNNDDYKVEHGKNIVIYDYKSKKNNVENAKKARIKLTDDYDTNVYNYKKLKNNINQFLPMLGANPDDGLKLGFINTYTTYGFERNPFTSQHKINAAYYFSTNGYELGYNGTFANVIGNLNLGLEARFQSPNFSINFFGYGNETENVDDDFGLDYNRVKVRTFSVNPKLIWNSKRGSTIEAGVSYEVNEVHDSDNRFVSDYNLLPNYVFDEVQFGGINARYTYENNDHKAYPTNALAFSLESGYKNNFDESGKSFGYLISSLGVARKLNPSGRLVLSTKLKTHINFGDGFEFYQAASIGGIDGLRGYRNQRFTGKTSFYQNTDLRYSFSRLKTPLVPVRMGVYGGFDYGRIWLDDDNSKKWHNSYGAGFFVNAAEIISANLGVFSSSDGQRIAFGFGFIF